MANRWGKSRNNKRFYFLGFQNRCGWWLQSHEIKRHLLLGKKAMTNLDSILKSRDITLPTKVCIVKAIVFPVVMYGCEIGPWGKLSAKELKLLNCCAGEDSWESPDLQGNQTSQSERKSVLNGHRKDWCWSWSSNTLAIDVKSWLIWKRPWCWEKSKAKGEAGGRGLDG